MIRRTVLGALVLGGLAAVAPLAGMGRAEAAWPDRPVTLIVPWAAGGGTDAVARMIASKLEDRFKQPFNVVNRPGGGGIVGHTAIAQAPPDGYTIGLITAEVTTYKAMGTATLTAKDLTPVALANFDAAAFNVSADSPWKDLTAALEAIRKEPGKYKMSGMPVGAAYHLAFAGMLREHGIDPKAVPVVPSQGAAPGFQELAAGGVAIVPSSLPEARAMMDAGRVKALAVLAEKRLEAFPNVPTVQEATGKPIAGGTWRGIAGPAGLPEEIVGALLPALESIHKSQEFKDFMNSRGFGLAWAPRNEFGRFMAEAEARNAEIIKDLGLAR